jgi:hypothetical protein
VLAAHANQALPTDLTKNLAAVSAAKAISARASSATLSLLHAIGISKLAIGGVAAGMLVLAGVLVFVEASSTQQPTPAAYAAAKAAFVLHGTVRMEDGRPLSNALVRLATPQAQVRLYETGMPVVLMPPADPQTKLSLLQASIPRLATTDPEGKFVFEFAGPPQDMRMALAITSDSGYALVTATELMSNHNIVVQPWGRVEGELRIGKSPGAHQIVNLGIWGSESTYDWSLVSHGVSVNTDEQGRFVFPRVAPGDVWLTRTVTVRPRDGRQSGHHYIKVLAGQTNRVSLGGFGCTLAGRVVWDGPEKPVFHGSMWAQQNHNMRPPRGWRQMAVDERRVYERQWRDSSEGELFKCEVRNYEFAVGPDGSFRVEDILPAHYRMQVRSDGFRIGGKTPAAEIEIDVPEVDESKEEGLDIGDLMPILGR